MNYLARNLESHRQTWGAIVPYTWRDYSAWRLIAELFRRHPGEFEVYECPYAAGIGSTVWHIDESAGRDPMHARLLMRVNNTGSVTIERHSENHGCRLSEGVGQGDNDRLHTLDVIFSTDLAQIVAEVEQCMGLVAPSETPETTDATIGHRVIAAALGLMLHTKTPLRATGYLYDGVREVEHYLKKFAAYRQQITGTQESKTELAQVFFLHDEPEQQVEISDPMGDVILAFDLRKGTAQTAFGGYHLMSYYEKNNQDIDALAFELVQVARADAKKRNT